MRILKVNAIDSTNVFLRNLYREKNLTSPICVVAHEQMAGRGQIGSGWSSNAGENLTCSMFMPIYKLPAVKQFYISIAVSLAIYETLRDLDIPKLAIKWPNDILSDRYKICGILIENIVNNGSLIGSVIGIGLNVNQKKFKGLPRARSLTSLTNITYDLEDLLLQLLKKITIYFDRLPHASEILKVEYESLLFRKKKVSTFLDKNGNRFVGIIQNIADSGKLRILLEDDLIKDFDLKEVQLLY